MASVAEQPPVACGDRLRERGDHERESTREDGQRRDETGVAQERERDEQRRMRGRSGLPDGQRVAHEAEWQPGDAEEHEGAKDGDLATANAVSHGSQPPGEQVPV